MSNIFRAEHPVGDLLNVLMGDWKKIAKIEYNIWTHMQETVTELTDILEGELNTDKIPSAGENQQSMISAGKMIFRLRGETNYFLEKCKERTDLEFGWKGTTQECAEVFDNYRKGCIPLIISIAGQLNEDSEVRQEIERRLDTGNYPMMY